MSEYKYQSPIEMIQGEMKMHMDDEILKAVQDVGVVVDRDELLKALAYDRDQYNKGYHDAEPKVGKWFDHSDEGYVQCPFCGSLTTCEDNIDELHYCFNCGAKMERRE